MPEPKPDLNKPLLYYEGWNACLEQVALPLREVLKALRQSVMNRRAKLGLSGCICCGYDYCIEGCPLLAANALAQGQEAEKP